MWSICRSCRVLLRRVPACLGHVRRLHLWCSSGQTLNLRELIPSHKEELTHLSAGLGFCVVYAPFRSPRLWLVGTDSSVLRPTSPLCLQLPPAAGDVRQVASGMAHGVVLTTTGEVFSFSLNDSLPCGILPRDSRSELQLHQIPRLSSSISKVVCGLNHTLYLGRDGRVYACGWSADGQTGIGHYENVSKPTQVSLNTDEEVSSLYTYADTSFALTASGKAYGWGNNEYGQLASQTTEKQVCVPVAVDCSSLDGQVVSMATGGAFTAVLTAAGSVYYAGYGIVDVTRDINVKQLSRFVKLHSRVDGRVVTLQAGLHYLVMQTEKLAADNELVVWGRYPSSSPSVVPSAGDRGGGTERRLKLPGRAHVGCGPDQLLVLLD